MATAFGHQDVDGLYDQIIQPTLKNMGIDCLRVDRVEHNEDIDNKIFELMSAADFCIADLTYARPSVYYEAGHMTGAGKQVIYTVRNDHFRQRDEDKLGDFAVHFDLKMKNIIGWDGTMSKVGERLASRINHVLRPLIQKEAADQQLYLERQVFQRRSLADQIKILKISAGRILTAKKFKVETLDRLRGAKKVSANRIAIVDVFASRSFTKSDRELIRSEILEAHVSESGGFSGEVDTLVVCASPNAIPKAAFRSYFSTYASEPDGSLYREYAARPDRDPPQVQHRVTLRFLPKIESEKEFDTQFETLIQNFDTLTTL